MKNPELSSSQKGKIAELYIASSLMAASEGRLSAFVPLSDDDGVDLIILNKKTKIGLPVQVKSWLGDDKSGRHTVQFDVRKATFDGSAELALIALILNPQTMAMEMAWLIPMAKVPDLANGTDIKFALSPSRTPSSKDKYTPYRHSSILSLTKALSEMIETKGR